MAAERRVIHVSAESEVAEALHHAMDRREPLFVSAGEIVFEVHVHATETIKQFNRDKPYSILDIAGLAASGTKGSIADHKDEYIADAYDYKRR
jgi:hypothetical protein